MNCFHLTVASCYNVIFHFHSFHYKQTISAFYLAANFNVNCGYGTGKRSLNCVRLAVVIRHLILPGQVSQAKAVMDWVAAEFGPGTVLFSLMSQYTPWGRSAEFPEIHRRLRAGEMRAAAEYMANLGLEGFTQERTSAQREYTPPFDLTGVAGEGGAL